MKTPVNLITGFLGVGKTTAILDLLARRPVGSPWAVLVNEFGQVGIDGATLTQDGVAVREVPGGCICCTAQLPLRVALTKLIREVRPERLLIEPTGLGHPAGVIDALRGEGLASALELRNVICLVDPRQLVDARFADLETYQDQLSLADILVANKCDLASGEQMQAFNDFAARCYPPKRLVAAVSRGRLDLAWLDRVVGEADAVSRGESHAHDTRSFMSHGWKFEPEREFDAARLDTLLARWAKDERIVRAKGVLHIGRTWRLVNLVNGRVELHPIAFRRDNRVEVIALAASNLDWIAVEAELIAAMVQPNGFG